MGNMSSSSVVSPLSSLFKLSILWVDFLLFFLLFFTELQTGDVSVAGWDPWAWGGTCEDTLVSRFLILSMEFLFS